MTNAIDPKTFYNEQLPAQWNRNLRQQARIAKREQRILEGMRTAQGTICVLIEESAKEETFYLNIRNGELSSSHTPDAAPFLTLTQSLEHFERLAREAGGSPLGFLGGLMGLPGEMRFTQERIEALRATTGTVLFRLLGEQGFDLTAHFGGGEETSSGAATTITIAEEAYRQLKTGQLDLQDAFFGGQIQVQGNLESAMQLAMTMTSPD